MSKLLILTAGTNPPAIASVLTRVKEIFDYDKVLVLATSASKNDALKALKLLEKDGLFQKLLQNKVKIDEGLMDSLTSSAFVGQEPGLEKLRKLLENKCNEYDEIYVDITGGTKLMSSATALVANSLKASSGSSKVLGPCDNVRLCLGYLTHLELSQNALSWWSSRLCQGCGYYPKVPRVLETPWNVDLESWSKCDEEKNLLPPPKELPHPLFQYGETLEPLLRSVAAFTLLFNSLTFGDLSVRSFAGTQVANFIEVKNWGTLAIEVEGKHELFEHRCNDENYSLAPISGLKRLIVREASNSEKLRELLGNISIKEMGLAEFLLLLRRKGYGGPIYLDSNALMYGFHNELFVQDMVASLMGYNVYSKRLNVIVPQCVFYEVLRIYEERRKYTRPNNPRKEEEAVEFVQASVASMVAKHFVKDVGKLLSFCDPALHELVAEGGLLITADSGLYNNVKNDESVKGIAIKVDNCSEKSALLEYEFRKIMKENGYSGSYALVTERLARAAALHAAAVQALAFFMTIADAFGLKYVEVKGERVATLKRVDTKTSKTEIA